MSECERIIADGILPERFFEEEVRCDFLVTKKRKKIWAVELELLLKFDEVCKKHGLRYYLSVGTLLGAVRHQGFIPWDDDIDVEMPRSDYNEFISMQGEFTLPHFLQTPYTDSHYAYSHIRLQNINTSAIIKKFAFNPMCQGIFVDIFPLDRWDEKDASSYQMIDALNRENGTYMRLKNPLLTAEDFQRVKSCVGRDRLAVYEEIQRLAQQYNKEKTEYVLRAVRSAYDFSHYRFYAEDYANTLLENFEGFQFPIPAGYQRILAIQFGEYMAFPPVEERGKWHEDIFFDPDVPYERIIKDYQSKLRRESGYHGSGVQVL